MLLPRFLSAGVSFALLFGSSALAQGISADAARNLSGNIDRTSLIHVLNPAVKSTAQVSGGVAWRDIATTGPLTPASALSSFRIAYLNGHHAQRGIMVARKSDGNAHIYLSDSRSGDDPLNASATWWTIPGAVGGEVSGNFATNGDINFTVPAGPSWHYLVLSGFEIRATNSVNNFNTGELSLRRLSVNVSQSVSEPRVQLPPQISVKFDTHDAGKPIFVKVSYVWVPYSYLRKLGSSEYYVAASTVSNRSAPSPGAGPFGGGVLGSPGAPERALANMRGQRPDTDCTLLTGFNFEFLNEPRPLLSFGVHLMGDTASGGPTTEGISWQDDNRDDPINWSVSYVTLK
jgi:hypothetical protein